MEEKSSSLIHTIDESIEFHQKLLDERKQQLEGCNTSGREKLENEKAAEEKKIKDLQEKKEKLLANPKFLFLIAFESDRRVMMTLPTYIETSGEAKYKGTRIMEKLIKDNNVQLELGRYLGLIVRKSYYDNLEDKEDICSFSRNENVYVMSEVFVQTDKGVFFPYHRS